METIAIIDFETTGMSPDLGGRATEVAVVLVAEDRVVDRFQSLMNAGEYIPRFIEELTGISNAMIRKAPPVAEVMRVLADFVGDLPLVAHNASFDRRFLDAEWDRIDKQRSQEFACSMLLARRVYQDSPNYKLGTLADYLGLPWTGRYHRALADAEMTAQLLMRITADFKRRYSLRRVPHELLQSLQKTPKRKVDVCIELARARLGL